MIRAGAEIRLREQSLANLEARLPIPVVIEAAAKPEQTLRGDGGGRAVYRLMRVERIGRRGPPVAQVRQTGSAGIPIRNAIGRRVFYVEIASGAGSLLHHRDGFLPAGQGIEELQLLGETAHGPG